MFLLFLLFLLLLIIVLVLRLATGEAEATPMENLFIDDDLMLLRAFCGVEIAPDSLAWLTRGSDGVVYTVFAGPGTPLMRDSMMFTGG